MRNLTAEVTKVTLLTCTNSRESLDDIMGDVSHIGSVMATTLSLIGPAAAVLQRMREARPEELSPAMRALCSALNSNIRGNDKTLRIDGRYTGLPVTVIITRGENEKMRLSVSIKTPIAFRLQVLPRTKSIQDDLRVVTCDDYRLKWIKMAADNTAYAAEALKDASIRNALVKLCVAGGFVVQAGNSGVELQGEIETEHESVVLENMQLLRQFSTALVQVSEQAKAARLERIKKVVIPVAVLAVFLSVGGAVFAWKLNAVTSDTMVKPVVVSGWRPMVPADTDGESLAWVASHGQRFYGEMTASLDGQDPKSGELELLVSQGETPTYMAVVHVNGRVETRVPFPSVAFALHVPAKNLEKIRWVGESPKSAPGSEGFLVVAKRGDIGSATLFLLDGKHVRAYRPADYRQL